MRLRLKNDRLPPTRSNWREYQNRLKKSASARRASGTVCKYTLAAALIIFGAYRIITGVDGAESHSFPATTTASVTAGIVEDNGPRTALWDKKTVQSLLDKRAFTNLDRQQIDLEYHGEALKVETSLDLSLQRFIHKRLNQATSRYIGIVVMDPVSGKILSMVSFDRIHPENNPNIDYPFPAASVFKIVTAAAAIDKCGFNSNTTFSYNGRKHTLYKSQLKNKENKYTRRITLKDAFAQSINPVFGKIGVHYLDGSDLQRAAAGFGFNRPIDFEIPVASSSMSLTDKPFQRAEIASGFNRETRISNIHAALITSTIFNRGRFVEPSIIEKITDENGHVLYRNRVNTGQQVITPRASEIVNRLMEATVCSGTAQKAFRGHRNDKVLSRLTIGGKTGSIDNSDHDARYDWFVGFAQERAGTENIVVSVLVAHEKYIGTRASCYARMAIRHYFHDYFNRKSAGIDRDKKS